MDTIIYNPPLIETPLDIFIHSAGITSRKSQQYAQASPFYNICYYIRGNGTHARNGARALPYGPGTVAVGEPGIHYTRIPRDSDSIDAQWINFTGPKADEIFSRYNTPAPHLFFAGNDVEYLRYFTMIFRALKAGTPDDTLSACAMLLPLIVETLRRKKAARRTTAPDEVNAFTAFCRKRLHETELPLDEFLARHRLSYESFRKKFRRDTGVAPRDYWLMAKLSEAKRLLKSTGLPVETISGKVGIEPPAYFSRLFRKKEGVTPTEFRERDIV
ncbi:MAG: helix-turn-helix domain-containing protein [Spirochaetes bacterium]|nr:helix-turn-helix domain-containing protein [Spirochaetota bacterium]